MTDQVSHRAIICQSRLWSQRSTKKVNGSHHGDNPRYSDYAKLSLSNAARLSFSDLCILLFMFLSLCRLCVCVFLCSHWSLVDVPLIFFCPADHVPDWQPRVLLGMVEARSVNVKKTTTTTTTNRNPNRDKTLSGSTCNGTDQYQNGSSNLITPYREQPRTTRNVAAYPRPAFSAKKRKNYAPQPVLINNVQVSQGHTHCTEIRKIEIPRSMVVEALSW